MDPLSLALTAFNSLLELKKMYLEALAPELRAEEAKWAHEDLKAWREFFQGLKLPTLTQQEQAKQIARAVRDEMQKKRTR
jgi:formiminotetrahydrofolate cyclodeaminase